MKIMSIICSFTLACILLVTPAFSQSQTLKEHHLSIDKAHVVSEQHFTVSRDKLAATFSLRVNNQTLVFVLSENTDLFAGGVNTQAQAATQLTLYKGVLENNPSSWARFSYNNGAVSGAFFNGEALILLRPFNEVKSTLQSGALRGDATKMNKANSLVAIDTADISHNATCGLHGGSHIQSFVYNEYIHDLENLTNSNSTSATKQISINLFADTQFVNASNNDGTTAVAEMLEHLNIADGIFSEQLSIQIVLDEAVELTDNGDLTSTDPEELVFALRNSNLPNPGLRHLFTGRNLDGSTVGIAFIGSLCRSSSAGVTQRFSSLTSLIFTHELGHNFGAPHDNQSGSSCQSTPSGFVMNPNINGSGSTFSACSVSIIEPVIASVAAQPFSCIADVVQPSIEITSVAGLTAQVSTPYIYDADNTLDIVGTGPFTYTVDIGPDNFTIDANGTINWTPSVDDIGTTFIQITVENAFTSASQNFEVEVTSDFLDLEAGGLVPYGRNQDVSGGAQFNGPFSVELTGNTWKALLGNYSINANTVIEFDFTSTVQGEIHGIGFDSDDNLSEGLLFAVYGSQSWGVRDFRYTELGATQSFTIPVGEFYSGNFDRLVLIGDNDRLRSGVNATFSNIRIYDTGPAEPLVVNINFDEQGISAHRPGDQDLDGTAFTIEDGSGFELTGNKWQKMVLNDIAINDNTVIEFEFKSTSEAEIHGIGFLPGNSIDAARSFNLFGTQNWGIQDFRYTNIGEYQTFVIPVGQYLNQSPASFVFIMDNDAGDTTGNSTFRNLKIYP